jgi:peptidoglycan-associated lipoprotein
MNIPVARLLESRVRGVVAVVALALLYGCSSPTVKDDGKPAVEERTPTPAAPAGGASTAPQQGGGVTAKPLAPSTASSAPNPLKDPNNILSKRSIFYDYDSDVIKEEFQAILRAHARYLVENRSAKVLVQGNTDERGGREYNLALGQRRAEAVRRALVLMNVQEAQVEAVSLGKEKPRCDAQTDACFAQNRRSDLLYNGEY